MPRPRRDGKGAVTLLNAVAQAEAPTEYDRLAYSVDEAAAILGIARETIYELIRTGQLRSRKAGSRRIIGRHHLMEFLDGGSTLARDAG